MRGKNGELGMPHLYTTLPASLPEESWKHDQDDIALIRVSLHERPYFIKVQTLPNGQCRLSLLTTPIDLILNHHKRILLTAAQLLGVDIIKSNLGNPFGPDVGTEYLLDEEKLLSLDWRNQGPKVFEIGSGNGVFLTEHAARNPETFHLGTEINGFTLKKALRKAVKARLKNISFIRNDAQYILNYYLPEASLDTIFINFPDPWEKKRHIKRRLINPETLLNFARVLKAGGEVHFATDHLDYADYTRWHFSQFPHFHLVRDAEDAPLPFPTKYERKWRSEGRKITRMTFRRTEHPLPLPAGKDRLIPGSFDIESSRDISSGKIFKTGEIVVIFKDVFKGSSYDVLDTIITLGRYRWDVLLLRKEGRLVFDTSLNRKFLTRKIKEQLETLFAETPPTRSKNQINPIV